MPHLASISSSSQQALSHKLINMLSNHNLHCSLLVNYFDGKSKNLPNRRPNCARSVVISSSWLVLASWAVITCSLILPPMRPLMTDDVSLIDISHLLTLSRDKPQVWLTEINGTVKGNRHRELFESVPDGRLTRQADEFVFTWKTDPYFGKFN